MYEGYAEYDGTEVANTSRTVQLARAMGITTVRIPASKVAWIDAAVAGSGYANIANAPWYDPGVPASAEFAGVIPMRIDGLDDSTLQAQMTEYITDGGHSGKARSATLPVVWDVRLIAKTERGAEFGKRWLARVLAAKKSHTPTGSATLRNLIPNPDYETDVTHTRLTGGTNNARVSGGTAPHGTYYRVASAFTQGNPEVYFTDGTAGDRMPVTAGKSYVFSLYCSANRVNIPQTLYIYWYTAAGARIMPDTAGPQQNYSLAFSRRWMTAVAPAGAVSADVSSYQPGNSVLGTDSLYFDAVMFHEGTAPVEFFTGTIPSGERSKVRHLTYFRTADSDSPKVHRRDVKLTRGISVTRKVRRACSALWSATFTMTAGDPFEYGEEVSRITSLGQTPPALGPGVTSSGTLLGNEQVCPSYNYDPLYDPAYPALVAPPTVPEFLPAGWTIEPGDVFQRQWARISPVEPSALLMVPIVKLVATQDARMVRVSIFPGDSPIDDQCDPLWSVVVTYLPANTTFYIDGEQQTAYVWDGSSPVVRRTDSLIFGPDAKPVQWTAFNDNSNLLVCLDVQEVSSGVYEGGGTVRAALGLMPKSD